MANQFSDWFAAPPQPGLSIAFPAIKVPGPVRSRSYHRASIILDLAPSAFAINDIARMCTLRSNDRISAMFVSCAGGTAVAAHVGLYNAGANHDGPVLLVSMFASALSLAGTQNRVEIYSQSLGTQTWKRGQMLWELIGLTADPVSEFDIAYTATTTLTTADANSTLELYGSFE